MSPKGQSGEKSTRRFSDKDLKAVETSENAQVHFKDCVVASKGFSENEKAALKVDSVAAFKDYWEETNSAKEKFDRSHEKGCGLWAKRYQSSAAVIQPFVNDFSPIIQIVRDFGAPYGAIAVGTMSLLFAVAGNKNGIEKSLASTLSSIQDRLPGLKLYQNIYNENAELDIALQSRIVSAYRGFMHFCIAATKYYKSGGSRRWLRALSPTGSLSDTADEVQDDIVQIRHLCEELLNKNVDIIKRSNMELKQDNVDLKAQITELQKGHDYNRLNEVQRFLNLDEFSEEAHRKEWDTHVQAVDTDDDLNAEILQQMRGPELDSFRASEDYQSWRYSKRSCLLILSGSNDDSILGVHQCWLSPIAAAAVKHFDQQEPRPLYAYYALPQNGKLLHDVVSVILLQLLRQKSGALRDEKRHAELRSELGKLNQRGMNEGDRVLAMERVALRVIDFFDESETLYIVVDRADRCRDFKTVDHRKVLLKIFIKMVEAARCKLRVLTVINGHNWRVENHQDELGAKMKDRFILHTKDQEAY